VAVQFYTFEIVKRYDATNFIYFQEMGMVVNQCNSLDFNPIARLGLLMVVMLKRSRI
jgi:hypothetical protein